MKFFRRYNRIVGNQFFLDRAAIYGINAYKKQITGIPGIKKSKSYALRIMLMENGDEGWQFFNRPVPLVPKRRKR